MIGDLSWRRLTASWVGLAVGVVSALVQLGPVLGRGYVLTRDMVFVPRAPLDAHLLGIDTVPRGVPSDLLVALASRVVPGDAVQDLVLLAIIALSGWGAARLAVRLAGSTRTGAVSARSAMAMAVSAAVLYSWNPYLAERLRQGQWAVLVGYAALPWVASTALAFYAGEARAARRLFLALAFAAAGGASAELLAVVVGLPIAWWPGSRLSWRRRIAQVGSALVVVSLPWAIPALTAPGPYPADRVGVLAFAARADTPFGTVGSLLGLGGMWNAQVAMPGHGSFLVAAVALGLSVAALWALLRAGPVDAARGLVLAGVLGFAIAVWAAIPGVRRLAVSLGSSNAGGLLRDGQRWLAPFVLLVALGFGCLVRWAGTKVRFAPVLALAPVLLLPAAAWGSDGALVAVHWPKAWTTASAAADRLPSGPVLVLPWTSQRQFGWNGDRVLAEPAADWLPRRVVADDSLRVGPSATPLEDPLARRIAAAVNGAGPLPPVLRAQGYSGVLVEADQPGARSAIARLAGLEPVVTAPTLRLYAVRGAAPGRPPSAPRDAALAGDLIAGLLILSCLASLADITTTGGRNVYRS